MENNIITQYEQESAGIIEHAESIMIVDDTTREIATEFTTKARAAVKVIKAEFGPDIAKAHSLHKDLLARQNKLVAPFESAKRIVDRTITEDFLEQERERKEEQRIADEKAEAERLAQEAELQTEAEEAIKVGDLETAEDLLDTKIETAPVVPVAEAQKTTKTAAGTTSVKKDIAVDLIDKTMVIAAVSEGRLPDTLIDVNLGAAKRYAKAAGAPVGTTSMPGFQVRETAIVAGRAR